MTCNSCNHKYFGYPSCHSCQCDPKGSVNLNCNGNGQCSCKSGYSGFTCTITNTNECPGEWSAHGYPRKYYKACNIGVSFDKARKICSDMGGILVEPRSSSEDDIIATLMRPIVNTGYWIGLNDKNRELRLA